MSVESFNKPRIVFQVSNDQGEPTSPAGSTPSLPETDQRNLIDVCKEADQGDPEGIMSLINFFKNNLEVDGFMVDKSSCDVKIIIDKPVDS